MTTRIANLGKQFLNMAQKIKTDITLYTTNTPNGIKPSILLEELNLEYKVHAIKMTENEQKEEWFLKINPNGRIPALTDTLDGKQIRVFESGAMLQYLVDRYDKDHKFSFPQGSAEHWEMTSWLMWQMGGLGPMQGQANHFKRYAPEKIEYGINRYTNETRRLYRTLDTHLSKQESGYIVGGKVTIADISIWGWVASASKSLASHTPSHILTAQQSGLVSTCPSSLIWRSGSTSSSSVLVSRPVAMFLPLILLLT
jgi:glutathione S-transferase